MSQNTQDGTRLLQRAARLGLTVEERFAERMKAIRVARHWSAQHLADASGVSRVAISKIENADRGVPLNDAVALADALGVPLLDMIRPGTFTARAAVEIEFEESP